MPPNCQWTISPYELEQIRIDDVRMRLGTAVRKESWADCVLGIDNQVKATWFDKRPSTLG